ncbi:sulfite reductase (NADPH) flavoprotein alpha-component [Ectothiorhodospira magna]|uniref:Sulfite reductase (NADPH) flavoprotein alpha-component n=1 Tax=Ectothiorhodospira magna TaxID=867345 RepID=A0A1H9CAS4_9GAMM|nr:PepSY domain-containing protein [Ectothiorhodospira magna]SEP98340.1 sulfite reductase (NADPH) flavoprotein alpha-component [Ectothiorhodospira magna]
MSLHFKEVLRWLHRWVSLILFPLFALIIVTGAILSFDPVLDDLRSGPAASAPADAAALVQLLDQVDPGQRVRSVVVEEGGVVLLEFRQQGRSRFEAFDLDTGEALALRGEQGDFFNTVKHLHKDLLLNAAIVVEIATYLMVLVIIVGPFLAWPRLRRTLMGWHGVGGWIALPLVLMVSVTGILMSLHIGTPQLPPQHPDDRRMGMAPAIEAAMAAGDLSGVRAVDRFKNSAAAVQGVDSVGEAVYMVSHHGVIRQDRFPGLVTSLHEGTWAGAWSGLLNLLASIVLMGLMVTGLWSWARRIRQGRRRSGDEDADILVAYASQTGTAARLADLTRQALQAGGARVMQASVAGLSPVEFKGFRQVFLIASTAGEGQVPEQARSFLKALEGADLAGCRFSVLALGDRGYTHFCRGGEQLRSALMAAGGEEALPMVKVDGDPAADWRRWLDQVAALLGMGLGDVAAPQGDQSVRLTLRERRQLNDPTDPDTHEVWSLRFESAAPLAYRPGDLLLVRPGVGEPARPYSIGSTPEDDPHSILLTVALVTHREADGTQRLGKASGLLCRQLKEGDVLEGQWRAHPDFNPPEDPKRPMIMLAAGCGIAPFIGFIAEQARRKSRRPAWLIFGNRKRGGDFFHGEKLEAWHRDGYLERLDAVFSRDPDGGGYVQDRLSDAADALMDWVLDRDAVIYVCGNARTLGEGVRTTLARSLASREGMTPDQAARRLGEWEAAGKLRMDLID